MRRVLRHRAFTLIELLIVIAIIAIVTASSMAVMTAPAEENVFANADYEAEAGQGLLFGRLAMDCHAATTATVEQERLVLEGADSTLYFVDEKRRLRRAAFKAGEPPPAPGDVPVGSALVPNVHTFDLNTRTPGAVAVRLAVRQKQLFRDRIGYREGTFNIGGNVL